MRNDWLENQVSGEDVYTYLMGPDGTIFVHTLRPELVGSNTCRDQELFDFFFLRRYLFVGYLEESMGTHQFIRMEYVANGMKTRGIIRKIEDGEWYLAVAAVEDRNIRKLIQTNSNSFAFYLLMLTVILLFLYSELRIKTELDEKNQLLTIENEKDFLTGIFNRRYFDIYMKKLRTSAERHPEIGLLMMDTGHFRGYNDTNGHIRSDEVLVSVTETINSTIRKQDVFARYCGEEFVLVLDDVSPENARTMAGKIVEAIYTNNIENSSSPNGRITISIGIAVVEQGIGVDARQFTDMADRALYEAKVNGRNTYAVYSGGS